MSLELLIDECMSPRLPPMFWDNGIHAFHVRDRGMLGYKDHVVWDYAQRNQLAVCTVNGCDFGKFARKNAHYGLIVIPHGGNLEKQLGWTMSAISYAQHSNTGAGLLNRYIEIDEAGQISSFEEYGMDRLH